MAELVALFLRYPEWVGEQAIAHSKKESPKFVPSVPQVEEAAEKIINQVRNVEKFALEWDCRSKIQLMERAEIERGSESIERRRQVAERVLSAYRSVMYRPENKIETADDLKTKHGLTDAEWDAIPNQPDTSQCWKRLGSE